MELGHIASRAASSLSSVQTGSVSPTKTTGGVPFSQYLDNAMKVNQEKALSMQQLQSTFAAQTRNIPIERSGVLVAQGVAPSINSVRKRRGVTTSQDQDGLRPNVLNVTPFQVFIDKAVDSLEGLSDMEAKVNDLIEQFIQGKVGVDEVSMETAKLNLAVSFIVTVVTTATQTFKELQQIPV